jgi:hypothetical protein
MAWRVPTTCTALTPGRLLLPGKASTPSMRSLTASAVNPRNTT